MKTNLKEIVEREQSIKKLFTQDLPIDISWNLSDTIEEMNTHLEKFHKTKQTFLEKYGTQLEDDPMRYNIHDVPNFNKDLNDLLNIEVEIKLETIPYEIIKESNIKLSPIDIKNLKNFLIIK